MNIPNTLTILRILLVPIVIWALAQEQYSLAFYSFMIAGVSDALDGFIARQFDMRTELGAFLDPLADKLLIMSIYVTLAIAHKIPLWLTILVISRDILIMGGILVSWVFDNAMDIKPHFVSKANTTFQIIFAATVLASLAFNFKLGMVEEALIWCVTAFTLASALIYLSQWSKHMTEEEI